MTIEPDPVVIMVPGDLHLTESDRPNYQVALWAIDQANEFIRPDFVQFIGDNVQDATNSQFQLLRELTTRLSVPWHALVGDHDVQGDIRAEVFRTHVGDPCGSLSLRGFRFIRLNTQESRPLGLSTFQIDWFRAEVELATTSGERVVIFQHNYPYQIWENFAGSGIDAWRLIVQQFPVHAFICGHTHYFQIANDGRNAHVATRSIGDPEGGPAGYLLLHVHGDDLAVAYRTPFDQGPLVLITSPRDALLATAPVHVVHANRQLRASIWSAAPIDTAWGEIDSDGAFPLKKVGGRDRRSDWSATIVADRHIKGIHRLRVWAIDHAGNQGKRTIEFVVDHTGRYTAVPAANPRVESTDYC